MRFRTGLVVGGIIGYFVGREFARQKSEDQTVAARMEGPRRSSSRIAEQSRRLAERASWKGVEAIQRARAGIQRRLEPGVDDLSMN